MNRLIPQYTADTGEGQGEEEVNVEADTLLPQQVSGGKWTYVLWLVP